MFELKSYTRKELATLYFPNHNFQSATRFLRQLLLNREGTENLLHQIGRRRVLTKQEVIDIVDFLGEP